MSVVRAGASKILAHGQTHPMELIFLPMFIMVFVGSVGNAFYSSGIQTTPVFTGYPCILGVDPSCSLVAQANANGCAANPNNCNITTVSSISILNPNSPFTFVLSGDLIGFLNSFTTSPTTSAGSNLGLLNVCSPYANRGGVDNITGFLCNSITWLNNKDFISGQPPIVGIDNDICQAYVANWSANCFIITTSEFPTKGGWGNTCNGNGTMIFANWVVKGNVTNPNTGLGTGNIGTVSLFADYCNSSNPSYPDYALVQFITQSPNLGSTGVSPLLGFFGFIGGILLFIAGLAITFSAQAVGTGFSFGIQSQGAKLCQVFGIGLMIFMFIFSEFGAWLLDGTLNLGMGIALLTMFSTMFFVGLYWRIFSYN